MEQLRQRLGEGIFLTCLPADKFKTGLFSAQFITPLRRETAACNALLPAVLRRGTAAYPDMASLEARLDLLYGASVSSSVRKRGESQLFGFVASCVDDAFVPGGEALLEPVTELLGELVCAPALEDGALVASYVDSERANLVDSIRSVVNDKRSYAAKRLLEEMCAGEPYGLSHIGEEETAAAITAASLTEHYRRQLAAGRLELLYCGRAEPERVRDAFCRAFAGLPRGAAEPLAAVSRRPAPPEPRVVTETMDVTQGKLSLGFRVGTEDLPAAIVMNAMYGGTSNSKLFLNVREKLSLCYYASSSYHRQKGLLTVASGIEFADYQRACDEILAQLEDMRAGRWEDWEFSAAMSSLRNSMKTAGDSAARLEDYWMGQLATGRRESPEELLAAIEAVTPERVRAAAGTAALDTVYFLKGKEAD